MSLVEQVATGDLRVALSALRDVLAGAVGDAKPSEIAAPARVLADVLLKLDGMRVEEKSDLDDLARRRDVRRAGVQDGAGKAVKRG